ncbi:MAG TPA: hypothetical protein VGM53_17885 [Streptosporangiaceae bacterium]
MSWAANPAAAGGGAVSDNDPSGRPRRRELPDAQAFAGRLAVLDRGEILQTGSPHEVVLRPAARPAAPASSPGR